MLICFNFSPTDNKFLIVTRKYDELCADDEIREAFKVFDMVRYQQKFTFRFQTCFHDFQNGDGFITRSELTYVMENIGLDMAKGEVEVNSENIKIQKRETLDPV